MRTATSGSVFLGDIDLNSKCGGVYCDNSTGGLGNLRLDAGCWTGYQPVIKVEAQ